MVAPSGERHRKGRCGVFAVWKLCDSHQLSGSAVSSLLWGRYTNVCLLFTITEALSVLEVVQECAVQIYLLTYLHHGRVSDTLAETSQSCQISNAKLKRCFYIKQIGRNHGT